MGVKTFEGEEIDGSTIVLKGYTGAIPVPLMRGEKIRLVVEAEVKNISFDENLRNGKVYRVHRLHTNDVHLEVAGSGEQLEMAPAFGNQHGGLSVGDVDDRDNEDALNDR